MMEMNILKLKEDEIFKADIKVLGIGGGGCNALQYMVKQGISGVDFIAVNTDLQHLNRIDCEHKIQLGRKSTRGLGAGSDPDMGKKAAEEDSDGLADAMAGADIIFVVAGFGGGTGTGAAPVIARIAKELGILCIGMITKPFSFEGKKREKKAVSGVKRLKEYADTIVCISNDKIFDFISQDTSMLEAFNVADNMLYSGVKAISDLITCPGLINLDFADVRNVMSERGRAVLAFGEGTGKGKVISAVEAALASPYVEKRHISGAKGILVNITGGCDITLYDVNGALKGIQKRASEDANIVFGTVIDKELKDKVSVTIIATGLDLDLSQQELYPVQEPVEKITASEQTAIEFPTTTKGRFEKLDPTVYETEDLDVPTFMRRSQVDREDAREVSLAEDRMKLSF